MWTHSHPAPGLGRAGRRHQPEEAERVGPQQCSPGLSNWFRGRRRTCGGLAPLTFSLGTESRIGGRAIRTLPICSAAKLIEHLGMALSLCSLQREWSATFFSSTEQGTGQRDLQTVVSLLVSSWPFWHHTFQPPANELPCRPCSPRPDFPNYSCATFWNPELLVFPFETNPDFPGHWEGKWHCCLSAP